VDRKEKKEQERREKAMAEIAETWTLVSKNFDWQDEANCVGLGDLFFFDRGSPAKKIETARGICKACKVSKQCLKFALDNRFEYGIWGGKTPKERMLMLGIHSWSNDAPH